MSWTFPLSGDGRGDSLEGHLTAWLRDFEPGDLTPAVRLQTFRDLRDLAERPEPRFGIARHVGEVAASLATLAATVAVVACLLALAASGAAGTAGAGLVAMSPIPGQAIDASTTAWVPGWVVAAATIVLGVLAGMLSLAPRVRHVAWRAAYGAGSGALDEPRSLPRGWREVPWPAWGIGAAAIAYAALLTVAVASELSNLPPEFPLPWFWRAGAVESILEGLLVGAAAVAVTLRYPFRSRSGQLLLVGAAQPILAVPLGLIVSAVVQYLGGDIELGAVAITAIRVVAVMALAAGIARRAGSVGHASRAAGAATVVACMGVSGLRFLGSSPLRTDWAAPLTGQALGGGLWIAAWLGILWVSWNAARRSSAPWPWRLITIAAIARFAPIAPSAVFLVLARFGLPEPDWMVWLMSSTAGLVSAGALAAGLLWGLRQPTGRAGARGPAATPPVPEPEPPGA